MALPSTVPEADVGLVPVRSGGRPPALRPQRPSRARSILVSARPKQWIKNAFVLVPAGFGGALGASALGRVALAAGAFCLASSALYLINDVADRDADRLHERKRYRPIAAGVLTTSTALTAAALGLVVALGLAALASPLTAIIVALYAASTGAYSAVLKNVAILDVLIIASGFVLRVLGGAAAAHVTPSKWLLLCMMFLALFLGFGKRRHELLLLGPSADTHRRVLGDYSEGVLDQFLGASVIGTLFSYALYTFLSPTGEGHQWLLLTIPFAIYGIFRYMLVVETRSLGGAPEELLFSDRPLLLSAAGWIAVAGAALYLPLPHLTW